MRKINLLGQRFGFWTVVGPSPPQNAETFWQCRCQCGCERPVGSKNLRYGRSLSCGCATKEMHGMSSTVEYALWRRMLHRCTNPANKDWHLYGGKGVKIEWKSFTEFLRDMGKRPSVKHSIDRINSKGNYSKANCRWATAKQQARNMRSNRPITANGKTMLLCEWAELSGISRECIEKRLDVLGWNTNDAVSIPVQNPPATS